MSYEPTERQRVATEALDAAIRECWAAACAASGDSRFERSELLIAEWMVLVGVLGSEGGSVDLLLPGFPSVPVHHAKGLLVQALDDMRTKDDD